MDIKEMRIKAELSREQLAAKVGVSMQTIFRWEKGVGKPHRHLYKRLEQILKKEVESVG